MSAVRVGASRRLYLMRDQALSVLGDRSGPAARSALALSRSRVGAGAMKLVLEGLVPLARPTGLGEAVRYFIRRA